MSNNNICQQCGKYQHQLNRTHGMKLCNKHYNQYKKYGYFIDNNPRTQRDLNEYRIIDGEYAEYDLYDVNGNWVATGYIDVEDIEKVKYHKWNFAKGYASCRNKRVSSLFMHRLILDTDQFVDHINHNGLDNRKDNLRIVSKSQNQMNANYKGVYKSCGENWMARIKLNGKTCHIGTFVDIEEAYYARWYAEQIVFKEYAYQKEEPNILDSRKNEIKELVISKVQRLDIPE